MKRIEVCWTALSRRRICGYRVSTIKWGRSELESAPRDKWRGNEAVQRVLEFGACEVKFATGTIARTIRKRTGSGTGWTMRLDQDQHLGSLRLELESVGLFAPQQLCRSSQRIPMT